MNEVKKIPAIHGFYWVRGAWDMFNASRTGWMQVIGSILVAILGVSIFLGVLAKLSDVLVALVTLIFVLFFPVLWGGLMVACSKLEQRGELAPANLLDGFQYHPAQLVSLGGLYLAMSMLVDLIVKVIGGDVLEEFLNKLANQSIPPEEKISMLSTMDPQILLYLLLFVALSLSLMSAYWFAPALVALKKQTPFNAFKLSLRGLFSNFSAFLMHVFIIAGVCVIWLAVYALVMYLLPFNLVNLLLFFITFGGYFLLVVASAYLSFKDIFGAAELLPEDEEEI